MPADRPIGLDFGKATETAAMHGDAPVIDSHNDTIVAHIRRGNYSFFGEKVDSHGMSRPMGTIGLLRGPQEPRPGASSTIGRLVDHIELLKRGFTEAEIRMFLGENTLRVIEAAIG